MGYRELEPGWWFKPVGHVLLSFVETDSTWSKHFKAATGKVMRWESKPMPLHEADPLRWLKDVECYGRLDVDPDGTSHFELGTALDSLLG